MLPLTLFVSSLLLTPSVALTFEAFPATQRFAGTPAPPDLSSREAHRFRTLLRREAALGPNFAGHFRFVWIGAGQDHSFFALVDAASGSVTFSPTGYTCCDATVTPYVGTYSYRIDSELLVVNGRRDDGKVGPFYFRLHDGQLESLQARPASPAAP
jgi:hypothetical protein